MSYYDDEDDDHNRYNSDYSDENEHHSYREDENTYDSGEDENMRYSTSSYSQRSEYSRDRALKPRNRNESDSRYSNSGRYSSHDDNNTKNDKRRSRTSRQSHKDERQKSHYYPNDVEEEYEEEEYEEEEEEYTRSNTTTRSSRSDDSSSSSSNNTIALFGAYGITGHYFLKFALEAGYNVRVLLLPGITLDDMDVGNDNLTTVTGPLDDEEKVRRVVKKASYVVCMVNDCNHALHVSNIGFIQRLLPILKEYQKCKVILYQASTYAKDPKGSTPMLTSFAKKLTIRKASRDSLHEQDKIIKYIYSQTKDADNDKLKFIITRPSDMIWDRPSRKKLAASKSLPGPFPITNIDLAEFSLNALKTKKLYNTCPYVVQDGV